MRRHAFCGDFDISDNKTGDDDSDSGVGDDAAAQLLVQACSAGRVVDVQFFLSKGVNVDATNEKGVTGLMLASENGHCDIVEILLQNGANANRMSLSSAGYSTALLRAANNGHASVVACLLKIGKANVDETDRLTGYSALICAAKCGNLESLRQLIIHGAKAGIKGKDGLTALSVACNEYVATVIKSQLVPPITPIFVLLFISFSIGLTIGYLLSYLPTPLRNS